MFILLLIINRQIDPEDLEKIEEDAKILKKKYLNKKYFFSQTGPADHETQNNVRI
jgi:hypothetical protein